MPAEEKSRFSRTSSGPIRERPYQPGPFPKRFKSSYIFFSMAHQDEIKAELGGEPRITDVSKRMAAKWKAIDGEERERWEEVAKRDRARYEEEMANYHGPIPTPMKRQKKDPSAPKRPMSAFLAFSQKHRSRIKSEDPTVRNTDVSKRLAQMWKDCPEEEKNTFVDREKKERAAYKIRTAEWKKCRAEEENREKEQKRAEKKRQRLDQAREKRRLQKKETQMMMKGDKHPEVAADVKPPMVTASSSSASALSTSLDVLATAAVATDERRGQQDEVDLTNQLTQPDPSVASAAPVFAPPHPPSYADLLAAYAQEERALTQARHQAQEELALARAQEQLALARTRYQQAEEDRALAQARNQAQEEIALAQARYIAGLYGSSLAGGIPDISSMGLDLLASSPHLDCPPTGLPHSQLSRGLDSSTVRGTLAESMLLEARLDAMAGLAPSRGVLESSTSFAPREDAGLPLVANSSPFAQLLSAYHPCAPEPAVEQERSSNGNPEAETETETNMPGGGNSRSGV